MSSVAILQTEVNMSASAALKYLKKTAQLLTHRNYIIDTPAPKDKIVKKLIP